MLTRRVYSRITIPMEKSKFNIDYRKSDYDFFVKAKPFIIIGFYKGLEEFKV